VARKARKRHTRKQRRRVSSVLKWGPTAVARHRTKAGRTGGAHFKKRQSRRAK
jgi:hypothetical protein